MAYDDFLNDELGKEWGLRLHLAKTTALYRQSRK